jgi:hypothetical protein
MSDGTGIHPGDDRAPVAVLDRIKASVEEFHALVDKFDERPDRLSQASLDELRTGLRLLRRSFGDYEIDVDRISRQLGPSNLGEVRRLIRGQGKLIDDLLWNLPCRATDSKQ